MKNKIKARSYFMSNFEHNHFKLLKVIKKHLMNYKENQYNISVILNAQTTLFTTRQKIAKRLKNYTKNVKSQESLQILCKRTNQVFKCHTCKQSIHQICNQSDCAQEKQKT